MTAGIEVRMHLSVQSTCPHTQTLVCAFLLFVLQVLKTVTPKWLGMIFHLVIFYAFGKIYSTLLIYTASG